MLVRYSWAVAPEAEATANMNIMVRAPVRRKRSNSSVTSEYKFLWHSFFFSLVHRMAKADDWETCLRYFRHYSGGS
jgi:hypothetical protein